MKRPGLTRVRQSSSRQAHLGDSRGTDTHHRRRRRPWRVSAHRPSRSCRSPTRCCGSRVRRTGCRGAARSTAGATARSIRSIATTCSRMKMVWARGMGTGTVEATPLVYDGVMYARPRRRHPGDRRQDRRSRLGASPRSCPRASTAAPTATSPSGARTLIDGSADNQIYAVDVHTGNLVWETAVMDAKKRARSSAGPIIANGKVITGRQCQPDAGNDACIVTAHDAQTGKEVWRTRTIPLPGELGYETWGDVPMAERWHVGRGWCRATTPRLNLIFVGTSVTIPAPKFTLAGNDKTYLYHNSTLAIERRHRQDRVALPARRRSLGPRSSVRAPARRTRRSRPIPRRSPWINPQDRSRASAARSSPAFPARPASSTRSIARTGEFLWARPTIMQNVIKSIDGATGAVTVNPDAHVHEARRDEDDLPERAQGGKNWPAGAYNPRTNVMFMPMQNHVRQLHDHHRQARSVEGVRARLPDDHRARHRQGRQRVWAISAETGRRCGSTAARGRALARRDRWRPGVWRRRQRPVPRLRRSAAGKVLWENEPRVAGERLSDHVRRGREAVSRRSRPGRRVRRTSTLRVHARAQAERHGAGRGLRAP